MGSLLLSEWVFHLVKRDAAAIKEEIAAETDFWRLVVREMLIRFLPRDEHRNDDVEQAMKNANIMLDPFIEYFDSSPPPATDHFEAETRKAAISFADMFMNMAGIVVTNRSGAIIESIPYLWRANLLECFLRWAAFARVNKLDHESARGPVVDIIFETIPNLYIMKQDGVLGAKMRFGIYVDLVYEFEGTLITDEMIQQILNEPATASSSEDDEDEEEPVVIA